MKKTLKPFSTAVFSVSPLDLILQDIAANVQIQANFCIQHPDYKPFELPSEIASRFEQFPSEQRLKYLTLHSRSFLYGIYYNASMRSALARDSNAEQPIAQNFENNTVLGVDPEFFEQLHQSNQGIGYFEDGWMILRHESDGTIAVQKSGLTLHLDRDQHLASDTSTTINSSVAIRMPKNLVQNGFYMAVGNAGIDRRFDPNLFSTLVRVYFNYSTEGAIAVMSLLTERLNALEIPFSFKTLYNPSDYERYDSGVLYFDRSDYSLVRQALTAIYAETRGYFRPEIPLFTKPLAPGVGLAEEPKHKFTQQESFGMNRCQIVAQGLIAAQQDGEMSPEANLHSILQAFATQDISCETPYLNSDSADIYLPLSLC